MDAFQEFFNGVDVTGLQDLILAFVQWVFNFDAKTINTELIPQLLTIAAPIWNPIWELVNQFLNEWFGF